eukprot:549817-Pleurochrysis_carterae.AAC.1
MTRMLASHDGFTRSALTPRHGLARSAHTHGPHDATALAITLTADYASAAFCKSTSHLCAELKVAQHNRYLRKRFGKYSER